MQLFERFLKRSEIFRMDMENGIKVKLTVDLTRYANGLIAGTEGITVGRQMMWSHASDRFVTVCFPGIATLDVLWNSLEIIDEETRKEMDRQEKLFIENLKEAKEVTLCVGPRGGFRHLSYCYIDKESGINVHTSVGSRDKAYKILDILKQYNIPVLKKTIE